MTWAILGTGVGVIALLVWALVSFALGTLRNAQSTAAMLISFDQRAQEERRAHREQTMGLIDRFLSGDWEAVRLHEGTAHTEPGGFFSPTDQEEEIMDVVHSVPRHEDEEEPYVEQNLGGWGSADRTESVADALDDAAKLAEEDDLDSMDADRQRRLDQARERGLVT